MIEGLRHQDTAIDANKQKNENEVVGNALDLARFCLATCVWSGGRDVNRFLTNMAKRKLKACVCVYVGRVPRDSGRD